MPTIDQLFLTPYLYFFIAVFFHISLFLYVLSLSKKSVNWIKAKKIRFVVLNSFAHLVLALISIPLFHFIVSTLYPLLSGQDSGWGYGVAMMWVFVIAGGILSASFSSAYILFNLKNKGLV